MLDGLGVTCVAALGFIGGFYNDAIYQYLLPHKMERPAAAYHETRQHISAVHMGQRKEARTAGVI